MDTIPFADDPGYLNASGDRADGFWNYFFTDRDAFCTQGARRTDVSLNHWYRVPGVRRLEVFFRGEVLNVFGNFQLCACGGSVFGNGKATDIGKINLGVRTAANSATLQPFNALDPDAR